eukprot:s1564_g1.t1
MLSLHAQSDAEEWLEEIRSLVATAGTVGDKIGFSDFLAVMYLKHLEDTSSAFPLRQDAKLLEVHEQFADAAF